MTAELDALVTQVRTLLAAHGDPVRAQGQQQYLKSAMPFHGITKPDLVRLTKGLLARKVPDRATWRTLAAGLYRRAEFREERYVALGLAKAPWARSHRFADVNDSLALYREFIETGAWWDLVDETAGGLVAEVVIADAPGARRAMLDWAAAPNLWVRRGAILSQLGSKAPDWELLEAVTVPALEHGPGADAAGRQDFFLRKGVGWALRDAARRDPEWVRAYLVRHDTRLSGLTRREAGKHL